MNPILVQQMARSRMDDFDREAAADRLVALARSGGGNRPVGLGRRLSRSAGRVRLVLGGSAA